MGKSQGNLQNQLESYSVAAKGLQIAKGLMSGGSMLATVAGSALALATNANAGVIYSGVQNLSATIPAGGPNSAFVGFTLGGVAWRVRADNGAGPTAQARIQLMAVGERVLGTNFAAKLASGAVISTAQPFIGGGGFPMLRQKNNLSYVGDFLNSQTGFAGLKFLIGGNPYFGWVRLHSTVGPGNTFVSVKAIDWAYNDVAGASILAGEGAAAPIPEPSTMAMALLAAGSAGVLAWRKRRKQFAA